MAELLPELAHRRATRAFSPREVEPAVQDLLWQAVSVAPSHGNTQPTRIVVARAGKVREALAAALSEGNRNWAPAARLLFAVCANPAHDVTPPNSDGTIRDLYGLHVGIALGNLMAQAKAIGLVAHPMAGFDEPAVRLALGIPADVRVLCVVAVGYPGDTDSLPDDLAARERKPQERMPIHHLVSYDLWDERQSPSARELRRAR